MTTRTESTEATLRAALVPLAELPLGGEIITDREHVLYINAGKSITVGDVLDARAALAVPDLRRLLTWCADNNGECLGDHPKLLAEIRAALAKVQST